MLHLSAAGVTPRKETEVPRTPHLCVSGSWRMDWTEDLVEALRAAVLAWKKSGQSSRSEEANKGSGGPCRDAQHTIPSVSGKDKDGKQADAQSTPPLHSPSECTLLMPPPLTPLQIRTPQNFSHAEAPRARQSRRKWQTIARSIGHGRNYRTVHYVWRVVKQRDTCSHFRQ